MADHAARFTPPAVSLPKGGGAIRGIGEKFSANPATGTGSFSVPLPLSAGRSGFQPELALKYDSGAGNGPFGLGWEIGLPAITRKVDKGMPRYDDAADVFLLSDAEDLVPSPGHDERDGYRIVRFRPRVEGLFARIERWSKPGDTFWRTISRDNVTTVYGRDDNSRVTDPDEPSHVFKWLICESHDDKGNAIVYSYAEGPGPQRYIASIRYGNVVSWLHPAPPADPRRDWFFEVAFDWSGRPDPFSTHRGGFEVRTDRRCHQIRMLHHIPELGADRSLVRSLELGYADITGDPAPEEELRHAGSTRFGSFLMSVTQHGYDKAVRGSMPAMTFHYSRPVIDREVRTLDEASAANLPTGLGAAYQWADLDAEGVSGVLTEQDGAWWYKRNEGGGHLGQLELVATRPAGGLREPRQLLDLAGDGALDLVEFGGAAPGFHERTDDFDWAPHRGFASLPNLRWDDPNLRFADLSGDGHADMLITEPEAFTWHESLGEDGFGPARRSVRRPSLVFADGVGSVHLADVSGDGLDDLVRVANGEVVYWPNLGYGRFGEPVVMANPPVFDRPDQFEPSRVQFADLDGSGVADLVYGGTVYFNQSGNRWTDAVTIAEIPPDAVVTTVDLLATGTMCLVWSSPLPGDARTPLRYLDLMAEGKPHLLVEAHNGLGAETHVHYTSSQQFYLADRAAGRPWITRLPFPVHVVDRVDTVDRVSGNRFTSRYEYRHGYFDGVEREFRGFGRVDQYDAEVYDLTRESSAVPPVLTRTWFHLGRPSRAYAAEYYEGAQLPPMPDADEPEALRALRGSMLRQEVYALDGTTKEPHPYVVSENRYAVRRLQPRVFLTHAVEAIICHYERDPDDPRVTHTVTLAVNDFGQVTRSAAIGYGRPSATAPAEQRKVLATCTETDYTNPFADPAETPDDHRLPAPSRVRTYEITGLSSPRLTFAQVAAAVQSGRRLIEDERTRYRRNNLSGPCDWDKLETRALPFEAYRLAFTPAMLAGTFRRGAEDLIPDPEVVLGMDGAYVDLDGDGNWWIPTGRLFYGPEGQELHDALRHFFLPCRYRTPFDDGDTTVTFDPHDLQIVTTTDALDNAVTAEPDYRVLAPRLLTDANENRSAVAFDALGLVVATAILGKAAEADQLTGFSANLTTAEVLAAFDDPFDRPLDLLGKATTRMIYDLFAYERTRDDAQPQPAGVYTLARETHGGSAPKVRHSYSYSDGFNREIQKKERAEGQWVGSGWTEFNNKGKPVRQYEPFFSATHRCEFDAKAGVTKTLFYDPAERVVAVLHPNHSYEKVVFGAWQQSSYDVNDTVALDPRTDGDISGFVRRYFEEQRPNWRTWLAQRQGPGVPAAEADAATKATDHANTPSTAYLDTLGRTFLTRAHNGFTAAGDPIHFDTRAVLDIEGNQRAAIDAAGRTVVEYDYDLLGKRTRESGMDSGDRWSLADVAGKTIRAWDGRGHDFRTEYDALRRPTAQILGDAVVFERVEYGEGAPGAVAGNLRGRAFKQYDQAGTVTYQYDLKGNVTRQVREMAPEFKAVVDWDTPQPAGEAFVTRTRYDALNRPVQLIAPSHNVVQPVYGEGGLLEKLHVWTRRAADPGDLLDPAAERPSEVGVENIDYDPKGQRTRIAYRNGVTTTYAYDPDTFRLTQLYTRRDARFTEDCGGEPPPPRTAAPETPPAGKPCGLQNLFYTYDPAGNVTRIRDDAQQRVFYRNSVVEASRDYTYDPVYRLVQALGREHVGQAGAAGIPHSHDDRPRVGLPHPSEGDAMGRYCETYEYDANGNLLAMRHRQSCPGAINWSRTYTYAEPAGGNRLTSTTAGGATEVFSVGGDGYDAHGNLLRMAHLPEMAWDFEDRLHMTRRQAGDGGDRTYYVYDADGRRARKVTETPAGEIRDDRLYLGGFEINRKGTGLVRETLHVMDDKRRIALVETRNEVDDGTAEQVVRYQLGDHLGSAAVEVDDQAQVLSYEEHSPYGNTTYQAIKTGLAPKRYRYTGKERDEESGLGYHERRYYAPWLGSWVSCDPIGVAGGLNQYVYAARNPCKLVDPSGLKPKKGDQAAKKAEPEKAPSTAGRSPIPTDLAKARKEILDAVAREPDPTREWQRLFPEDPDDPEHNFWVAYAVNYALKSKGFKPGGTYGPKDAKKLEEALWFLTKDLRQADPKIGSSESLILRDAQRYLYGIQGDKWLSDYATRKYVKDFLPKEAHPAVDAAKPFLSGKLIDRIYEQGVKRAVMAGNSVGEEVTGRNPGWLRSQHNKPHSRTGGEDWYDLGMASYGKAGKGDPFITTTPASVGTTEPPPVRLKEFREIEFPGGSYDTKTKSLKFDPKTLPKELLRYSPF